MAIVRRFLSKAQKAYSLKHPQNLALILLFAAMPAWAQSVQLTGANVSPMEGPAFGSDTVLVYATGLQGTATTTATVTTDVNWIRVTSTANFSTTMNIQNGPNRVQFVFAANSGAAQSGHIVVQPASGGSPVTITVSQAAAGAVPAGPVPLVTSVSGPTGIDVDSQGNVYFADVTGSNLYQWTAATQQLTTLATKSAKNIFVDVAVDGNGDVFALENTPDGKFNTQVEAIAGPDWYLTLLTGHLIFTSNDIKYSFPAGICVDAAGQNLNVTAIGVSNKCLIDQFGSVYELDSVDDFENLGSFASAPTNAQYASPPVGRTFFPYVTTVDSCGNQLIGVSGSLYGLAKDGSGFIYFTDHGGLRLNRYDPTTPWFNCAPPNSIAPSYTSFTTVRALTVNAFNLAADLTGNIYLSEMPFSRIEEIPRAYVSSAGPINMGVEGGSQTIQIWPATQSLTGVFAPISSDTTWLNVTEAANGVVNFSVSPNSGQSRTGTLTVLGVPIHVIQAESQTPQAMTIISGNNQTATVGTPFATNLLVKVTNQWGDPSSGVTVNFVWPGQNIPVVTDLRGYAAVNGVNAYAAGPNTVTASIQGTGLSQVFLLKGYQNGISVFSGSNQSVPTNQPFAALTVLVLDANGQPLSGVPVTFSAPSSGASGTFMPSGAATISVNTALGYGTASSGAFQANATAGSYQVTASISGGGVSGLPSTCVFNLTNYAQLQLLVGDQTTGVNNLFPNKLGVKVVDSSGNPVSGAQVTFVSGDGKGAGAVFLDGTVSNSIATGGDGIAQSQEMIATPNTGTFIASATIVLPNGGGTLTANWKLTNVLSTIFSGAVQDGVTTRTLTQPFIVQASSTATAGTMTFTVIPGSNGAGGTFNGQNSVTVNLDPQGYGISPLLTANSQAGKFTVNAYDGVTTVPSTVTAIPCISDRASVSNSSDNDLWGADVYSLRYLAAYVCAGTNLDLSPIAGSTIKLKSRLRIDDNMTISGPASGTVTIDGGNMTRLFFIGNGAVTLSNLVLQNGLAQGGASASGGGGAGMGGAIFMQGGNVTLSNITFTGNQAVGGSELASNQCPLECAGGGGFAGNALSYEQGGGSGDLFGLAGLSNGVSGGTGGGGAGTSFVSGDTSQNGGNGGFGAGGGQGHYNGSLTSSGNGGFGGGGAAGETGCVPASSNCVNQLNPGTGGYGAGNGYTSTYGGSSALSGGSGAGFGGAIFEYTGQLSLNGVEFNNNSAVGGALGGLSGQPTIAGQGKGGALFIYNGAIVLNNGATFGTQGPANVAADAGQPGHGNSAAPYVNGATCPGQDTADVCGIFGSASAVTITVPAGFTFFINGVGYTGSQTLNLPQAQYTLTAPGPQAIDATSQLAFASWSDGGAPSHTITVGPSGLSITATFVTQYLLTTSAAGAGGSAAPVSGYFTAGSAVNLNALPTHGSAFSNWTGAVAAAGSAATTVTMSGPQTVIANFVTATLVNVQVPSGVSFTLNGANYTGSQFVPLAPGQYALSAVTPQSSTTGGQQIVFNSWSDGGALSHTITVGSSALSITGNFTTQYQLTASATGGGTVSSVSGFYNPATIVTLTATPNPGYVFHNWSGMVAAASSASTTITMNQAATVTANFWLAPSACVAAPANLTAWWKGEGTSNDETTLYTAVGSFGVSAGLVGNAFGFSQQQSSFLSFPAGVFPSQPGNGAFSFEAWFQTSQGSGGVILGQQDSAAYGTPQNGWSPAIYVGTDGNLYVEMFYSGTVNQTVSSVPVNDNQWHHVAVTYDGTQEITYLDGASIGQSGSFTQVSNGSPLSYQLGTGYTSNWPATNNGWYTFTGLIDEATTYSRALTGAEVFSIAQAGSYGKCDPVAALSPGTLSFPTVTEGNNASLSSQIKNSGNAPLSISSISLDANDTNFTLLTGNTGDCVAGTPVAAGASCSLRVQFAPQTTGSLSGQITITDNSVVDDGVQTLALSGVSVAPGTLILAASPAVTLQADPVTLTATINGNPVPTGTVTFFDATTTLGTAKLNGSGVATLTTTALTVGTHSLTAQYSGSKTYAASASNTAAVTITPSAGPPTVGSVNPNAGSGLTQEFTAQYSDPNGAGDLAVVGLLFNSSVSGVHACDVHYSPSANLLYLYNDAGTAVLTGITPGSKGTASNSQCTLIAAASDYLVSGNTGVLFVTITFKSALPTNIYLYAGSASSNSGWQQRGTWGVSAGPPAVVSVTPNAGSGLKQNFSAVFSDPNGAADLATVGLLFNTSVSGVHACDVHYSPSANLLYLYNDTGTSLLTGITPGSQATVSNSQCTLSAAGSSYSVSGNTATLNAALTFASGLPTNIYLYAGAASNSGWVQKGTWGVSAGPPAVVSVTPNAGSGLTQTFSAVYSDPNGAADLTMVGLLFNTAVSGVHACDVHYSPSANLLYLYNDAGTAMLTGITPGSAATVSNSQCTLSAAGSSYSVSGNTATLNVALTFTSALPTNIYLYAGAASSSGWVQKGTWNSAGPPAVVSVTPNAGSGGTQTTFSAVYSDPNGAADLATVRLLFNSGISSAHGCYVQYSPAVNLLYLENDGGTGVSAGIPPGSWSTLSNSQCMLFASASSYSASGNTATLNVSLSLNSAPPTNIYLYAGSASSNSGWVQQGTWGVSAGPPTVVSVTPNAGSGLTQTFSAVYSDPNGAADLAMAGLLFNTSVSGVHACDVHYSPAANLLYLYNDAGTAVLTGITPGSQATVSNSQCTLSAAGSSYSASGNTATLNVALTFTSALPTNIYLYAGSALSSTGWVQQGTWGVSAGPPAVVSVTPNAGSGLTQNFSAVFSDPNGAADLALAGLLFNTSVSGVHACDVHYSPAANLLYLYNDTGTGVLTGITPGSQATVSNSQCTLSAAGSSYSVSGNTVTLTVALTFASALPTNIYLYAGAASSSGWVKSGTWGVSAGPPATAQRLACLLCGAQSNGESALSGE